LSSGNDVDRTKGLVFSLLGPSLLIDEGCALGSALIRSCYSRSALARALYPNLIFRRGVIEISTLSLVPIHEADDAISARNARLSWMPPYHNV
jgi:hypothetical protein